MKSNYSFASDNVAGICPEAFNALHKANEGLMPSYGDDAYTTAAANAFRTLFETEGEVFFVCTGTAANSLALASLCAPYESVIACDLAHIETDECGAPEFFSNGAKLLTLPGRDGKLNPADLAQVVHRRTDIHYPRPRVVSLSQSTEAGTIYRVDELAQVGRAAREWGLRFHMDGARFANAVASTGASPADLTWRQGVDVLCFSGTKNGLAMGEAIIFFDPDKGRDFAYRCKQAGQLASKMRFLSAPWLAVLESGAWLQHATHANRMAQRLRQGLADVPNVEFAHPTEANGVFVKLPETVIKALRQKGWAFYTFIGHGFARFMCSWATTVEEVDHLVDDLRSACGDQ